MFVKTRRDKLIRLIQDAVPGVARYWAGLIADYLLQNGVEIPVHCGECKFERCSWGDPQSDEYGFCHFGEAKRKQGEECGNESNQHR